MAVRHIDGVEYETPPGARVDVDPEEVDVDPALRRS